MSTNADKNVSMLVLALDQGGTTLPEQAQGLCSQACVLKRLDSSPEIISQCEEALRRGEECACFVVAESVVWRVRYGAWMRYRRSGADVGAVLACG